MGYGTGLAGGLVGAVMVAGAAGAVPLSERYSSVVVFGDSLSDDGNLYDLVGFPPPPYADGRFSDGPVYAEVLAAGFAVSGNFAYGGAQAATNGDFIPDFATQTLLYAASGLPARQGSDPLAVVLFGANDLFGGLNDLAAGRGADFGAIIGDAVDAIAGGIGFLSGTFGIDDFLVANVPDLGLTPAYRGTLLQGAATAVTVDFNTALAAELSGLRDDDLRITEFDFFSAFRDLTTNPEANGFTNATEACLVPAVSFCGNAAGYLFFDLVHPTTAAHALIAGEIRAALGDVPAVTPVPLPAAGLMLLAGLGGLGLAGRRRAA